MPEKKEKRKFKGSWLFLGSVLIIYLLALLFARQKILDAIIIDFRITIQMIFPLIIAFIIMTVVNLYIGASKVIEFIGNRIGVRGILFSSLAGIISMGPIYAWYPMLKDLMDKGVPSFYICNFLGNRAIKPFLLPVMILFFGLTYTIVFNCTVWVSSIMVSYILSKFVSAPSARRLTLI
jgi:uncharacterized membrane protein YraQ (UPF0718 family)